MSLQEKCSCPAAPAAKRERSATRRRKERLIRRTDSLNKIIDFSQVLLSFHTDDSRLHFEQVRTYTKILLTYYNRLYPENAIGRGRFEAILLGAGLHDIGKISISDDILSRKCALTPDEYDIVKRHTVNGADVVRSLSSIYRLGETGRIMEDVCRYHHERYDGGGYPEGLAGDAIPLSAQIVSVAEVYSALTEENYHSAMTHDEAIQEIVSGGCGAFNPILIECLLAAEKDLSTVLCVKNNGARLAILQRLDITRRSLYWKVKRLLDVVFSLLALLLLSPLFLLIILAILIDDPKAAPFYKQVRLGRHRKPFCMYKFRTMCRGADKMQAELMTQNEKSGPVFKIREDPRITHVGRFLRKTSLDELPQFINVLRGDMAIVGPRPPLPDEAANYSRYHNIRLSVTPGITCTWQIQPARDQIAFEKWMDMDISYIATRSIWLDIKIVCRTVLSVLGKHGS